MCRNDDKTLGSAAPKAFDGERYACNWLMKHPGWIAQSEGIWSTPWVLEERPEEGHIPITMDF